jgi:hypothetical protein
MRLPLIAALLIAVTPISAGFAQMPTGKLPPGHPQVQSKPAANHTGKVLETIPAGRYVYIHVDGDAGDQWLATVAVELKTGSTVRWPEGMLMQNYHSGTLNRTFDKVYFVEQVEPVEGK